jgi:hypothetical protein
MKLKAYDKKVINFVWKNMMTSFFCRGRTELNRIPLHRKKWELSVKTAIQSHFGESSVEWMTDTFQWPFSQLSVNILKTIFVTIDWPSSQMWDTFQLSFSCHSVHWKVRFHPVFCHALEIRLFHNVERYCVKA